MPSMPNAGSPYIESRLQAEFGKREPGTPTSAGKPGVQSGDFTFPAPPAPASAPPGRPAETTPPAPAQARPAAPAQPAQPGVSLGAAPPATVPPVGVPGQKTIPGVNTAGQPTTTLTPEGDAAYRSAVIQARTRLGELPPILRNPALPEMPVEVGRYNYNPFTNRLLR